MMRTVPAMTLLWALTAALGWAADPPTITTSPEAVAKMLPALHLLEPFWRAETVYRESILFVRDQDGQRAVGQLLFVPKKILGVHSANGEQTFESGRDYQSAPDSKTLTLVEGSRIPQLSAAELFPPTGSERSIARKADDPTRNVLFDNGHWFHDQQVEVTYTRVAGDWPVPPPEFAKTGLARTLARLHNDKKLTLAISGDSISQGYNASAYSKSAPGMPPYPELVAAQLRHSYGADVTLQNRAIAGWNVVKGQEDLDALLAGKPNLVIIAYGMNDVGGRNPELFRAGIARMLERIHAADPQIDVILVSTMLGNADWIHTPREMFAPYREALASLVGPGVVLADMTSLWQELLRRKRDADLTGNGVNHPNDFGHRLYAQVILSLLVEP